MIQYYYLRTTFENKSSVTLPTVHDDYITDSDYLNFRKGKSLENLIPENIPKLDYFFCGYTGGKREVTDFILDFYSITGLFIRGFLVSEKFKNVICNNQFIIGDDYCFHPAFLKFGEIKLDYYIFQFVDSYPYVSPLHPDHIRIKAVDGTNKYDHYRFSEDNWDDFHNAFGMRRRGEFKNMEYIREFDLPVYKDMLANKGGGVAISGRFKRALDNANLSGYTTIKLETLHYKIEDESTIPNDAW